ncbi:MAG: helix-turn-helix transcriptional regulator [Clostridia bacterium]|nr:helix-turn-helix transcriptional regulator [Clostridia bacterium]
MEFNEKIQELRKQKGLTQEELAELLFVSRTAVSKWESGRGYPNIESLKALAKFFGVTVDELLSGEELLTIAQQDNAQNKKRICDLVFGLLDLSVAMFFLLPIFGRQAHGSVEAVSLSALAESLSWLKVLYLVVVGVIVLVGVLLLTLQNSQHKLWVKNKICISLAMNTVGILLFIVSQQPYAAALLFIFSIIKVILLLKKQ